MFLLIFRVLELHTFVVTLSYQKQYQKLYYALKQFEKI